MGIKDAGKHWPGDEFNWFQCLQAGGGATYVVDAMNMLYVASARHPRASFEDEPENGPAGAFHELLKQQLNHSLRPIMYFDGKADQNKVHERRRRDQRKEAPLASIRQAVAAGQEPALSDVKKCLTVSPLFILMAVKICRHEGVDFVIAPEQADAQLAAATGCAVVSCDSDMLAMMPEGGVWYQPGRTGGWDLGCGTRRTVVREVPNPELQLRVAYSHGGRAATQLYAAVRGSPSSASQKQP